MGVDYGRLYGFLARGARGGDGPELQPAGMGGLGGRYGGKWGVRWGGEWGMEMGYVGGA